MVDTVRELILRVADRQAESEALLAVDGRKVAFGELARQVEKTTAQLRALGIGPDDRVAIVLPNGLEMALAFLSIAAAATAAPLNPGYRRQEYAFYLEDLKPKAVVLLPDSQPVLRELAGEYELPVLDLVFCDDENDCTMRLEGDTGLTAVPDEPPDENNIALILHTSGTTSRPKMVPLSQANLCSSAGNIMGTLELSAADRCLNIMPLFHIHGLMAGLLAPVGAGSSIVCTPGFDVARFYGWVDDFGPTYYTAVPTMQQAILAAAGEQGDVIARSRLRFIRSSSASLPPQVMADLQATFGCPVIESYGMTEASHQMASNPLPPGEQVPGTVGPAAGPQVAIMEEDGRRLLDSGETGEIVIRGANVTRGYLENPEANASAFTDGWFRTGDQGVIDKYGYVTITGRLKEIINRGGEKIAPREIDEVLLAHPAVKQAVAFAMPDERLGEEVGAAVILVPGQEATERDLQRHVAESLADFKVPRKILFVESIPKGPTGKLQRVGLAAQFDLEDGLARPTIARPPRQADGEVAAFVAEQWRDILHLESVPYDSPFLDTGGDSIQATRLVNRLNDLLNIDLTIVDLFDAPTVNHQALIIEDKLRAGQAAASGSGD